jgi:hypothetical protein
LDGQNKLTNYDNAQMRILSSLEPLLQGIMLPLTPKPNVDTFVGNGNDVVGMDVRPKGKSNLY